MRYAGAPGAPGLTLVAGLLLSGPVHLTAQQSGTVASGTKIRVSAPSITPSPLVGTKRASGQRSASLLPSWQGTS